DAPELISAFFVGPLSSPRAWGCTARIIGDREVVSVLPTSVGMHRPRAFPEPVLVGPPYARRDEPVINLADVNDEESSLRSVGMNRVWSPPSSCPPYAGRDEPVSTGYTIRPPSSCPPCARRDEPDSVSTVPRLGPSPLRTWG